MLANLAGVADTIGALTGTATVCETGATTVCEFDALLSGIGGWIIRKGEEIAIVVTKNEAIGKMAAGAAVDK